MLAAGRRYLSNLCLPIQIHTLVYTSHLPCPHGDHPYARASTRYEIRTLGYRHRAATSDDGAGATIQLKNRTSETETDI